MKFNGKEILLEKDVILSEFLKTMGYDASVIAVEINYEIIPKSEYDKTLIHNSDTIEVVNFVGGG